MTANAAVGLSLVLVENLFLLKHSCATDLNLLASPRRKEIQLVDTAIHL